MAQVTLYQAQDGTLFETEGEQLAHDAAASNKAAIDAFIDLHFPIEPAFNKDGTPKLNDKGVQENKQNTARGPVRKALALWIAQGS